MADITLSTGIQNNLLSLQRTTSNIEETQFKLSTGRKVNSVLDDPIAFFKAQDFNYRASDLAARKDGVVQAQKTIEAATNALDAITKLVKQAQAIQEAYAADTGNPGTISSDMSGIYSAINDLIKDAHYQGINLLNTGDQLKVKFDEKGSSTLTMTAVGAWTGAGTGGIAAALATQDAATDVQSQIRMMDEVIDDLRAYSKSFGTDNAILETRREFTDNLVNTLEVGAGELVNADMNEESANMLALQTRQQLGTISLSIANQAESSVLRLF
ncbi:flagellin [uncultured Rhodospira sp.]|uniref:flagellin n=1 Tax=uncultured Rhodospira sp. TaxID=1936189 RepID=UPI00260FD655|nr:flagellin [uncultured Rhodospira sp.]